MIEKIKEGEDGGPVFDPIGISEDALVRETEDLVAEPAIAIGWYTDRGESKPIPFGSYGDFSCIVGASKSMKTKLLMALVSGYIGGKSTAYFPEIKGIESEGKYIIMFDTEQSRYHTKRLKTDILDMVGVTKHDKLIVFALRTYTPEERFKFVEWVAYESPYAGNIGLMCVDGAADLIDDTNDLVGSTRLAGLFMKISEVGHCHLITILHKNSSSNKPTGHIGSAVLKKAETVALLSRDEDLVTVSPDYTRNFPFRKFEFGLDSNFLPKEEGVDDDNIFTDTD